MFDNLCVVVEFDAGKLNLAFVTGDTYALFLEELNAYDRNGPDDSNVLPCGLAN